MNFGTYPAMFSQLKVFVLECCLFLKICSHFFMIFEVKLEKMILIKRKQEVERKSERFCALKFKNGMR